MSVTINVSQLGRIVSHAIPKQSYLVQGEVSQPKNFRGNIYLSLKDESCNIKSIIWKNKFDQFKSNIEEGDKITVEGTLDFYIANGSVSFIINKLVKYNGEGELHALFQKIKEDFEKKKYFDIENKFEKPKIIRKILLITSVNGDAIKDFIFNLDNNKSRIEYDIKDVAVQGVDCPKNIVNILDSLDIENLSYDMIVITRGGGSFEDLFGFSRPELIESVHKFKLPVLSAIGHKNDNPLLDLVSDFSAPTPSLASQFVVDINKNYIDSLLKVKEELKDKLIYKLNTALLKLRKTENKITLFATEIEGFKKNMYHKLTNFIQQKLMKLIKLESKIDTNLTKIESEIKLKSELNSINNQKIVLHSKESYDSQNCIQSNSQFNEWIDRFTNVNQTKELFISILDNDDSKQNGSENNENNFTRTTYKIEFKKVTILNK